MHPFFDDGWRARDLFRGDLQPRDFLPAPVATPRYDYNQIMYRLDLADPRWAR